MGWLIVNVLCPTLLPVPLLWVVKTTRAGKRLQPMDTVKDGQLCWFALTLLCSTFYDLVQNVDSDKRLSWGGPAMAGVAVIGLVCGLYAVVAAIETTPLLSKPEHGRNTLKVWMRHYMVFETSVALSFVAALVSWVIHVYLPAPP